MTDSVAVTGAEGFIGSHLVEALVRRGYRVRAMVLYNMWSSTGWLETLKPDVTDQVDVVFGDVRAQAAEMTLAPGRTEGGPDNRHRGADQWLYVVGGTGEAVVNGETVAPRAGTLLLIQRGERHAIRNTGPEPLRTLNVYVPPAYTDEGEELPAGRA